MSLSEYPNPLSKDLVTYVNRPVEETLKAGKGVTLVGTTEASYDLMLLTGRALIGLGNEKVRHIPFYQAMESDTVDLLWAETYPLVITNFDPHIGQINQEKYKRLENLLNYYLDNKIALYIHLPYSDVDTLVKGLDKLALNPVFLSRLLKTNFTNTVTCPQEPISFSQLLNQAIKTTSTG